MQRIPTRLAFRPSVAARKVAGPDLPGIARLALEAILRNGRSLEIAHQQIAYGKHHFVFASRIGNRGQLILELDLGDPCLAGRVILEDELRQAERVSGVTRSPAKGRQPPWPGPRRPGR